MRSGKTFALRVEYLKQCSGAAELTFSLLRYNYEPMVVDIRTCTFCGEVYNKRVYLSWLMRVSWQELREFARSYLS
jgi:hypothetical protein